MTVTELLNRMSSHELAEWRAYAALEPFGEGTTFLQMGIIASTIANVNRGKNTKAFTPDDFIPEFGMKKKVENQEQTVEDQLEIFKQIAGAS